MTFSLGTFFIAMLLLIVQLVAAIPWLFAAFVSSGDWQALWRNPFARKVLSRVGGGVAVLVVLSAVGPVLVQDRDTLELYGRMYGALLQVQLLVDFFVLAFGLLLLVWPKGGAVALAAFREGVRQSMFWLLTLAAWLLLTISPLVPYFTFGEDHLMVKELGYDTIMLVAVAFGTLAASLFISDEIEGRTAITLMSKPVSRRQFLLGKFVGILLAALVMFGLLGTYFEGVLLFKHWWDKLDPVPPPTWVIATLEGWSLPGEPTDFLRGFGLWIDHTLDTAPGLVLGFSQVMVLVSIAVALATRLPMVVNLTTVLVVYFVAHLTPVLLTRARQAQTESPGSAVAQLLNFVAQVFDTIMPDLETFRLDPALLSDTQLPPGQFIAYLASASFYGVLFTLIALFLGLILFEDRDLA
jgi:hypothetical protein